MNIADLIIRKSGSNSARIAIIEKGYELTYKDLVSSLLQLSFKLKKIGILPFDRVAISLEDSAFYIIICLAVLKLNAVIIPVPQGSSAKETKYLLDKVNANFFIFKESKLSPKGAIKINFGFRKTLFIKNLNKKNAPTNEFAHLNPAFIRFSSGTTGEYKGVLLSHKSIIERITAANSGLRVTAGDKVVWILPMSFHFVVSILLFLLFKATIIISNREYPRQLIENLKKYKPTLIYASPVHYHMLLKLGIDKSLLSNIRLAVSTSIKLPINIADEFYQRFGFELAEAYGIIEVGLPFINLSQDKNKRGSVGKALKGYRLKIINKDKFEVGTIYIKGKGMIDAYISPWRSRKQILKNGWFNTQDLGMVDKDDFLFITGRNKNVINFSGMKIFPFEVESVLNSHPLVKESYVYGVSHAEFGQMPFARIVLRRRAGVKLNVEELRQFCYKRLASYKVPKDFEIVSSLIKTLSGKVKLA